MTARLNKRSIASLAILALAAATALRICSWSDGPVDEGDELSLRRRQLMHGETMEHPLASLTIKRPTAPLYDRARRGLNAHAKRYDYNEEVVKKMKRKEAEIVKRREERRERKLEEERLLSEKAEEEARRPKTVIDHLSRVWRTRLVGEDDERTIEHPLASAPQEDLPGDISEEPQVEERLRDSKEVWLRGNFLFDRPKNLWHANTWSRGQEVKAAAEAARQLEAQQQERRLAEDYEPLTVCERPSEVEATEDLAILQKYGQCPEVTQDKPILLIEGSMAHGRTGNALVEFLHAIQKARDQNVQLGVMAYSWATAEVLQMWWSVKSDETMEGWAAEFERAFCVKVFYNPKELEGWEVVHQDPRYLLHYRSDAPIGDYMESQGYRIRNLFRNYNNGTGRRFGIGVRDMCSGINSMFGDDRRSAVYSVIHSRSLEGEPGLRLLGNIASRSGCDRTAALEMRPDYVKSILEPLGMMGRPIVFITDGQSPEVLDRLLADPEIGHLVRAVPPEARWIGGDLTLAVMSNVFIGNPASTFTGFIAKARLALGFGHNYLFRAKDEDGRWRTVCGDHCIYDMTIQGPMA